MELLTLSQHLHSFKWEGDLGLLKEGLSKMDIIPNTNNEFSLDSKLLDRPELKELRDWFLLCLRETCQYEGYDFDLALTQSWFNLSRKGKWHHRHYHANSFLSGVFYITPSNSSTWFSTKSIWPDFSGDLPLFGESDHKEVIATVKTDPGLLLIFPSNLHHSVDEHDLEEPRYSISFNTFPRGPFGDERLRTQIKVSVE